MKTISKYLLIFFLLFPVNGLMAQKIYLNQVFYDSPLEENKYYYNAKEHNNGEFIELYNPSASPVDISGYSLKGMEAYEEYKFPAGTVFPPKSCLIVAYKHGFNNFRLKYLFPEISDLENEGLVYYQNNIILNNKGEEILLMDPGRVIIDRMFYNGTSKGDLFARNGAGRPSHLCLSLHRQTIFRDGSGNAVFRAGDWTHGYVKPLGVKIQYQGTSSDESAISDDQTYVHIRTMLNSGGTEYIDNIRYLDGLGRPVQTVQRKTTPDEADLVNFQEYDELGRKSNSWLPGVVEGNNGAFVSDPRQKIKDSYQGDENPYRKLVYEASSLNRVTEQYDPGQDWHTKKKRIVTSCLTNDTSDSLVCSYYSISGNNLVKNNNYAESQLYVTRLSDEDSHVSFEFEDKLGQVVLTRQINGSNHDTYYVYDDFGDLRYVLPPEAVGRLSSNSTYNIFTQAVKDYCYYYRYDERHRCIEKKLPGCEPIYYMYDKADYLVFSQDGEQRKKGEWMFMLPDVLGRLAVTGICTSPVIYLDEVAKATFHKDAGGIPSAHYSYDGVDFDRIKKILTVNYYDNYDFIDCFPEAVRVKLVYESMSGYGEKYTNKQYPECSAYGLLTGTSTALLDNSGNFLYAAMYYDIKERIIQTRSTNHLGGFDKVYAAYSFTGLPLKQYREHICPEEETFMTTEGPAGSLEESYVYKYDHAGRFTKTFRNGTLIEKLAYNKLGQVKNRKQANVLDTDYTYNIRGWTKMQKEKNTGFEQELFYQDAPSGKSYNGNISSMNYKYTGVPASRFQYSYDQLSRLTGYYEMRGNQFRTEEAFSYDKHGNQTSIFRMLDGRVLDALSISYNGNQVSSLFNEYPDINGTSYTEYPSIEGNFSHNANGALTKDTGRDIVTIRYNLLNLPDTIQFGNGSATYYTYDAGGRKLMVKHVTAIPGIVVPAGQTRTLSSSMVSSRVQTDYMGGIIYEDGVLNKWLFPGGYTQYERRHAEQLLYGFNYYYNTDYQGNNRDVISPERQVVQRTEYSAFGVPYPQETGNAGIQPFKYTGKEFDRMHGLNWYDFRPGCRTPCWTGCPQWILYQKHITIPALMLTP